MSGPVAAPRSTGTRSPTAASTDGSSRLEVMLERTTALTDIEVADSLATARKLFADRHRDFDAVLDRHHDVVATRFATLSTSPITIERRRLEGARFVRFVDDDGTVTYYATSTAFDGQ